MILYVLIAIVAGEIITKWGLRGFLLLMHTCLHSGVPATKCRAQFVV
jgi:hypothetical protein